jgi:uncharacterized protein DUF4184
MPFTVSHAAAALPFQRLKPVWPALVIGTLAPDFEYFLRLTDEDRMGHHLPGLLILTLPLALLIYWLFEFYIRAAALELLPEGVQCRLPKRPNPRAFAGWKGFVGAVAWIVVGIATHVVWDWFTHPQTWIWEHSSWLRQRVAVPFHPPVVMSKLMQHVSSLVGLIVLAAWFAVWYYCAAPAKKVSTKQLSARRKIAIVGIMVAIAAGAGYVLGFMRDFALDPAMNLVGLSSTIFEAVTLLFCLQILLYGIVRRYSLRDEQRTDRPADNP